MNQAAKDALIAASLRGQKQAVGKLGTPADEMCAMGVIGYALYGDVQASLKNFNLPCFPKLDQEYVNNNVVACLHACGSYLYGEQALVMHLNDTHKDDFLTIANKMPLTEG